METIDPDGCGENTDELISADVDDGVDVYGLTPLVLSHDYCDRLLDAIDVQLNQLQTHSHNQMHGGNSKRYKFRFSGCLDRNLSASKDTGLGSTVPTNDKASSIPDCSHLEGKGDQAEHQTVDIQKVTDVCHPEGDGSLCSASRSEQCRWRLERLLGKSSEVVKMANEEDDLTMDSICTEDFLTRFRDEMLDLPGKDTQTADVPTTTIDTADLTNPQKSPYHERLKNQPQHLSTTPVRHLTGIPIESFDSVTIDTDLDTVRTEKVRQHLKSALSTKTGEAFCLSRENVFHTRPAIQNNILSFSSDDEGTVEETSGESCISKHYSRGWRRPSGRKGRSSHQNRRNGTYTSTRRPQDKIRMDKDQLKELRLSLAKLQQQKIAAVQSLEKLREEMYQTKKEQQSLKNIVRDSRSQVQDIRCELHRLQAQRDVCLDELRVLQEQQMTLVQRQKMEPRYDINCHKCVSRSVSVLERKEMDRLLDNAKSELFSEQRRFRETLDSMQEKLDEVNQELEQKDEDFRALQQKCSNLEKQLTDAIREREQIQESSQEDLKHQVNRFEALEQTAAQKELLLQGLEEEKKTLCLELCSLREQNIKLTEIQNRTKKEKEQEISQLTLQLTKRHQEEVQMVHQQADEFRSAALNEQAQAHKQTLDSLYSCIQIKDEEVKRLKDEIRRQAEELRIETQEKIEKTLKREEKKWEEQKEKTLKEQREILERQMEEVVKRERVEVEKERRNTLALQNKVNELQKQAEKDTVRLKESFQRSEQELQQLRTALSERDQKHQRKEARHERQMMSWAQDIHTECVCLQELLKHNGLTVESKHLCDSPTVDEALQTLQCLTKAIQQLINDLKNEINSQRRAALQLSLDKEQEFRLQKDQLTEEKERALASLKDKLIQEKMSSLSRTKLHMEDDDDDDTGLFARLRRQLKAKDDELRLVQKNMAEWKNKTTARLTHKIQLELTAKLDRVPKPRAEQQKRLERLENEMRHLTGQCKDYREAHLSSTALQNGPDVQHSSKTKDLTSYKLLQHLQSRIRQLQTESQTHHSSLVKRDRDARNLGGSYLDTIAPAPESYKKEYCSPAKTISS